MKTKKKIYVILATFMILALCLIVFLVRPLLTDIESISKEIINNRTREFFIYDQNSQLENFRKKYENYKPELAKINQAFVNSKNPIDFITFLEKTAFEANIDMDVNLVSSVKKEADEKTPMVAFRIFAKGNISNITSFTEKLETGPYLVAIHTVAIKKSEEGIDQSKSFPSLVDTNLSIEVATQY